jgi:hypothetical protein
VKPESDAVRVTVPALTDAAAGAPPPAATAAPADTPASVSTDSGSGMRTAALITAGAGVVALGVGTYLAFDAKSDYDAAKERCDGTVCDAGPFQASEDARSQGTIATVVFVVGGAAVATGAALWFLAPRGSKEAPPAAGLRVNKIGLGPGSVMLGGEF